MSEPVHIGIIGAGGWGTVLGQYVLDSEAAAIVALADVDESTRAEAGQTLGVAPEAQYTSHERLLEETALDGVIITSPHTLHYEHVRAALEHEVHILCEKPLVPDVEQAKDLIRRSDASEQILMVGYQRHVHPAYVKARDAISAAKSAPKVITAEFTQDWITATRDTWRANAALSGGGQLYDSGTHLLDAILWLTDLHPTSVVAEMVFDDDNNQVDIQALLSIRFDNDTVANVTISGDAPTVHEEIHLYGEQAISIEGNGWTRRELTITDGDENTEITDVDAMMNEEKIEAFIQAVRTGESPPATARDALRTVAVTEAAYESARTGERIAIPL